MREELVSIKTFGTLFEAELAKGFLETHAIKVFVSNVHISTIATDLLPIIGGIRLQVLGKDVERARQLLLQLSPD